MKYSDIEAKIEELRKIESELNKMIDEFILPIEKEMIGKNLRSVISGREFKVSFVKFRINEHKKGEQIILSGPMIRQKKNECIYGHSYFPTPNETTRFE